MPLAPLRRAFHFDTASPRLGHVGFVDDLSPDGKGTYSIEGNTNSEGSRTGGGAWRHTPLLRPLEYWNLGFADYSVIAAICLPDVHSLILTSLSDGEHPTCEVFPCGYFSAFP
jgi:hypothetical protein